MNTVKIDIKTPEILTASSVIVSVSLEDFQHIDQMFLLWILTYFVRSGFKSSQTNEKGIIQYFDENLGKKRFVSP